MKAKLVGLAVVAALMAQSGVEAVDLKNAEQISAKTIEKQSTEESAERRKHRHAEKKILISKQLRNPEDQIEEENVQMCESAEIEQRISEIEKQLNQFEDEDSSKEEIRSFRFNDGNYMDNVMKRAEESREKDETKKNLIHEKDYLQLEKQAR